MTIEPQALTEGASCKSGDAPSPPSFNADDIAAIPVDRMPRNDADEEAHLRQQRALDSQSRQEDISLKKRYGNGLLIALAVQLLIMNCIFFFVGYGKLKYEQWALHLYVSGTLLEIFALVLVVTKYLFPPAKEADKSSNNP